MGLFDALGDLAEGVLDLPAKILRTASDPEKIFDEVGNVAEKSVEVAGRVIEKATEVPGDLLDALEDFLG